MKKPFVTTTNNIEKVEICISNPPGPERNRVARKVSEVLFYMSWPNFQGPWAAEWVGTDNVESAWRYAEKLGFTAGKGRLYYKFGYEERGWSP